MKPYSAQRNNANNLRRKHRADAGPVKILGHPYETISRPTEILVRTQASLDEFSTGLKLHISQH